MRSCALHPATGTAATSCSACSGRARCGGAAVGHPRRTAESAVDGNIHTWHIFTTFPTRGLHLTVGPDLVIARLMIESSLCCCCVAPFAGGVHGRHGRLRGLAHRQRGLPLRRALALRRDVAPVRRACHSVEGLSLARMRVCYRLAIARSHCPCNPAPPRSSFSSEQAHKPTS